MSQHMPTTQQTGRAARRIKCVVWDLDNTLWDGVLLEDEQVTIDPGIVETIKTLDQRGILNSIASRNDPARALEKLGELGLVDYFLYPQINWGSKSDSIKAIATAINIGQDTIAFVDDQPFELDEVAFSLPDVLCIDRSQAAEIVEMPEMNPPFITEDSRNRRLMYLGDSRRNAAEREFVGPREEFLATLEMAFTIAPAQADDLQRAEELTLRTNQLNTTGYTYSYEELDQFRQSPRHTLLIASLTDRYGSYGKIGLALVERGPEVWTLKLLLMSCRVLARGVGMIMLSHLLRMAADAGVRFLAEFVPNDRNRMMYITYKFAGFRELHKQDRLVLLEADLTRIQPFPPYVQVQIEE